MDKTIEELFKEKNNQILKDKLLLDIDNNDDSLRLTSKNKVMLITSNIVRKINSLLRDNEIEYDVKTLKEMFEQYSDNIVRYVYELLSVRRNNISNSISEGNKTSLDDLEKTINECTSEFKTKFEPGLDQIIHSSLREDILGKYTFKEEEQKDNLVLILERYDSELYQSIDTCLLERNISLLNMFKETSNKVLELDIKTTGKIIEKK